MGAWEHFPLHEMLPAVEQRFGCGGTGRRGVFGSTIYDGALPAPGQQPDFVRPGHRVAGPSA
jgi:hypothetical protein